jgi:spoIIIJ-associated protein
MPENVENVEVSGRTVEEALEKGLTELGISKDEAEWEVLRQGSRGIMGLGAEEALVRVTRSLPTATAEEEDENEDVVAMVQEILKNLLRLMGVRAKVVLIPADSSDVLNQEDETPPVMLDVQGPDLGVLIGRRGETLHALQFMTRLMLNHKLGRWVPVAVDVEQYKVRRRHSLQQLALRMAERVSFSQQPVALEAMPPAERRIIHLTLRDHPTVTTESVGEGDKRKVTIIPRDRESM